MKKVLHSLCYILVICSTLHACTLFNNKTNDSKDLLILVNRENKLTCYHKAKDLTKIPNIYNSGMMNQLRKPAVDAFIELCEAAKKDGIIVTNQSAWRPYYIQMKTYNRLKRELGKEKATEICALPGHSEHQTGLALDVNITNINYDKDIDYSWVEANAHKYGFILRYPEGKESITGYNPEPWHYRYVGKEIADYIYSNNITLEEYYKK